MGGVALWALEVSQSKGKTSDQTRMHVQQLSVRGWGEAVVQGGRKIAVWGGRIQLRKVAENFREIAGNCDTVSNPP